MTASPVVVKSGGAAAVDPAGALADVAYIRGNRDVVREVRGAGLLIDVEAKTGATTAARDLALDQRVLVVPTGRTVLRYLPPLNIEQEHADRLVDATVAVADHLSV